MAKKKTIVSDEVLNETNAIDVESIKVNTDEILNSINNVDVTLESNLEDIKSTVKQIKKIELIDVVNYGESMVEKMLGAFDVWW
jgi:flagellar motor switch protein FliM